MSRAMLSSLHELARQVGPHDTCALRGSEGDKDENSSCPVQLPHLLGNLHTAKCTKQFSRCCDDSIPESPMINVRSLIRAERGKLKQRVLFLHGQATNAELACHMLDKLGYSDQFDIIMPDGPHTISAFKKELHSVTGVDVLINKGLYDPKGMYRSWGARYDLLLEKGSAASFNSTASWSVTTEYIKRVAKRFGPFDGVVGFCEGAATAHAMLCLQQTGIDVGLDSVRFFIGMAPWVSPLCTSVKLDLPVLICGGRADLPLFLKEFETFPDNFNGTVLQYEHNGAHVYPPLTVELRQLFKALMMESGSCWIQ